MEDPQTTEQAQETESQPEPSPTPAEAPSQAPPEPETKAVEPSEPADPEPVNLSVSIFPTKVTVGRSGQHQFKATVEGVGEKSVVWKARLGEVDDNGLYTAPAHVGKDNVAAICRFQSERYAMAEIDVI